MKKFQFLPHPTDLRVKIFGRDLESLFENSALAIATYMYPKQVEVVAPEIFLKIKIKSNSADDLLKNFIEDIIEFSKNKHLCLNDFYFKKISEDELLVKAGGRRVVKRNELKKILNKNIKIGEAGPGYYTEVIFDI